MDKKLLKNLKELWQIIGCLAVLGVFVTGIYHLVWHIAETWGGEWNIGLVILGILIIAHIFAWGDAKGWFKD